MDKKPEKIHKRTFDIAWGDMDALGHVNNGKFFDYFQQSRIEWLQTLNLDLIHKEGPVVLQVACTYFKPVVYPARLCIHTTVSDFGRSSMMMHHKIYQKETLMAEGQSKIVWIDYKTNKSVALPKQIRQLEDKSTDDES
jgi:acyl-CoA thioester hydrolase